MSGRAKRLALVALCGVLAACASVGGPSLAARYGAPLELTATPFFPQERYQCGPAALATVLAASGVAVTADGLVAQVYVPGRHGSLRPEITAATRRHGRVPFVIEPEEEALLAELDAGRPVLVLQNLGVTLLPRWHYAVVVGVDPAREAFVLRSGTERRRITPRGTFLRTWERGGNWGMVALADGELPVRATAADVVGALADVEATGATGLAAAGYRAVLARWPGEATAMIGLGNIALADGDLAGAEENYRRALAVTPDSLAALNNLAETLGRSGRTAEALALIEHALAVAGPEHALAPVLRETRDSLSSGAGAAAQD